MRCAMARAITPNKFVEFGVCLAMFAFLDSELVKHPYTLKFVEQCRLCAPRRRISEDCPGGAFAPLAKRADNPTAQKKRKTKCQCSGAQPPVHVARATQ